MSGTSSYILLEEESEIKIVSVNYDSNRVLEYLYFIHNKRSDWEYIIKKGSASSIGKSLTETEFTTKYAGHFSDFYVDQGRSDLEIGWSVKNLDEFFKEFSEEPFSFFMNKSDEIFVESEYFNNEELENNERKFVPIKEFMNKHFTKEELKSKKENIEEKVFRSCTKVVECNSAEHQETVYKRLTEKYENVMKDKESFDVFIVIKIDSTFYSKY